MRSPSSRLLGIAALLLLVADVMFSVLTLYSEYDGGFLDAGWLLSYVTWAAAALHPSMRGSGTPTAEPQRVRMTRRRLGLLAASSLLAPALLFVPGIGTDGVDRLAIGAGAVLLFLLVVLRMSGFVSQVQRQSDRARGPGDAGRPDRAGQPPPFRAGRPGGAAGPAARR